MSVDPAEDCKPSKYFNGMEPVEVVAEHIRLLGIGNGSTVDLSNAFKECESRKKKIAKNSKNPLKRAKEANRNAILYLKEQGLSSREIAKLTGVSKSEVNRLSQEIA
jgi:DNA-directed RNA polymerase specialized sigma subunit